MHTFYVDLAAQSVYNPMIEGNPACTRWRVLARQIKDGSFTLSKEGSWQLLANLQRTVDAKLDQKKVIDQILGEHDGRRDSTQVAPGQIVVTPVVIDPWDPRGSSDSYFSQQNPNDLQQYSLLDAPDPKQQR